MVGCHVYLGLRLGPRANAVQYRAAFERVLAAISMLFINAPSQNIDHEIVRALADMVKCIDADRGYFVMSGPVPRLHDELFAGLAGTCARSGGPVRPRRRWNCPRSPR